MLKKILFDLMFPRKHFHPFRHIKLDLCDRKFIENLTHNFMDILFFHLFTIHRQYCRFVFFTKFFLKLLRFFCIWFLTVKQYHKRLSYRFEFFYRPFFCLNIIFPRQIRNASVCRYNNPYCSMIPDHFLRPDCSRFRKRDLIFKPRCLYLPLFVLFNMAGCSFCHKTDTVDHSYLHFQII